jgi:hypothetical protein
MRNPNTSILRAFIDPKIDVGIHECVINRCWPLIYCLQMGDLNRAKCLLESGASVTGHRRRTGPALAFFRYQSVMLSLGLRPTGEQID